MKNNSNWPKKTSDVIFLAVLFLIALFFHIGSYSFRPVARLFPLFASAGTMICILIYFIRLLRESQNSGNKETEGDAKAQEPRGPWGSIRKPAITVFIFVGYLIIVYLFGFLIASAIIALVYPLLFGYKKPLGLIGSFVFGVGMVLIFQRFLGVPLSRGILLDLSHLFY